MGELVDGLPVRIYCPHCGCCDRITACRNRSNRPYWCGDCRKHFSVRTGSVLANSKIPLRKWAIGIHLHLTRPYGISGRQLAFDLGLTEKSALFMLHRIREGWPKQESLNCNVGEVDEVNIGGEDPNRHRNKKFGRQWQKGVSIAAVMYDRETGSVAAEVILKKTEETLSAFVKKHLRRGGTLFTDELPAYSDFRWAARHEVVNHKNGEYARDDATTNRAESFNSQIKGTYGIYRHLSPKYLPQYLNEITGRHNLRGMDTLDQMKSLVSGMVGKPLTHRDLLATEVPPRPFTHHRWKEGEPFRKVRKVEKPGEINGLQQGHIPDAGMLSGSKRTCW